MDIFSALEAGATTVTANARLSRDLRTQFHAHQRDTGRRSWTTPDVLPFASYLERLWSDWLYSSEGSGAPVLLSPARECAVWETIIGPFAEDSPLLDVPGTAERASEAWKIAHDYHLPIRGGEFQASDDCEAFLGWAREYEQRCRDNRWLDRATLPAFLLKAIAAGSIARPSRLLYAGFDELSPAEGVLLEALGAEPVEAERYTPRKRTMLAMPDARHEIEAAAAWARATLESGTGERIGVIVPDLQSRRAAVQRIFQRTLDETPFAPSSDAFHVSLGQPLALYPIVHAGLAILEIAASPGALRMPLAGLLLRSPFLDGAPEEAAARAAFDTYLRARETFELSLDEFRHNASKCPVLQKRLNFLAKKIARLPQKQMAQEWSAAFADLLDAAGWPGEPGSESAEYQAAQAWRDVLGEFASLSLALGPLDIDDAVQRLRRLASQTTFQPEDRGAPIQVMGVLEAGGLVFDQLWITGLHDGAFPAPPRPNPFLPLDLQIRHGVPHSTAAVELAAAHRQLDRLTASALEITLSHPQREGEQELRPTPLVEDAWQAGSGGAKRPSQASLEAIADDRASPFLGPAPRGGTRVPKLMSDCPFRAFAELRLRTSPLDEAEVGMSALARGTTVHKALEIFWKQTQSHAALHALGEEELKARIDLGVVEALGRWENNFLHELERKRLNRVLFEWLRLEKRREPFTVIVSEEKRTVEAGGLTLEVRVDRIDQLADGSLLILDYKTGEVAKDAWKGERMKEPQLPLYCAGASNGSEQLAGAAFACLRAGELGFMGVAPLPDLTPLPLESGSLAAEIEIWRARLDALVARFREGHAEVDPRKGACTYCSLQPLCRIHEALAKEGDDDDAG